MKIKPNKLRSISIVKGQLKNVKFCIGDDPIPTVSEQPVKSLGRWYNASLRDKDQVQQVRQDITNSLENINRTLLPGKLWRLQFGLLPRVMWPLTIYKLPITTVEKLERTMTSCMKKWLDIPRCLTNISLYGKGVLELPITSLTEEYKFSKIRLQMTLKDSRDQTISNAEQPIPSRPQPSSERDRKSPTYALCPTPATLKHILTGCKTSLTQGRYTWRYNQVLKSLAAALESERNSTNSLPLRATNSITAPTFIREGQKKPNHPPTKPETGQLAMARDWKMLVDIGQQLIFPPEIAATTLRPDLVLWSPSLKSVYITELTVP
ncbi:hypothetical protein G5714_006211 [Onychostoma macrolepis]|uniref:Uncharacterized protein n=1 Tax=Onychostoma macrolepis TaxID=369639 RepID=A0A7J6D375_9TELE|nr:hypothetical protein G5714_006211 [Onychostoma macrolepis]